MKVKVKFGNVEQLPGELVAWLNPPDISAPPWRMGMRKIDDPFAPGVIERLAMPITKAEESSLVFRTYSTSVAPETEHFVYAIEVSGGNIYYRLTAPDSNYLSMELAVLFEVTDSKPSRYWKWGLSQGGFMLAPPSFFADYYFDRLSDGEPELVDDFKRVKQLLLAEYSEAETQQLL